MIVYYYIIISPTHDLKQVYTNQFSNSLWHTLEIKPNDIIIHIIYIILLSTGVGCLNREKSSICT